MNPRPHIESWGRVPESDESDTEWLESAGGWPRVSLWSRLNVIDPLHNVVMSSNPRVLPRDSIDNGFVVSGYILPLGPIWPGIAINTVFYAAVLWMIFFMPFALRRRRRIKRGLCPKCAYPVGTNEVCTECGAVLPSPSR